MHPAPGQRWQVQRYSNTNDLYVGIVRGHEGEGESIRYRVYFPLYGDTGYLTRDRFFSMIPNKERKERKKHIYNIPAIAALIGSKG